MSSVAAMTYSPDSIAPLTAEVWASREMRKSPAAFKTAVRVSNDNWRYGSLSFVLPSGRAFKVQGKAEGGAIAWAPLLLRREGAVCGGEGLQCGVFGAGALDRLFLGDPDLPA